MIVFVSFMITAIVRTKHKFRYRYFRHKAVSRSAGFYLPSNTMFVFQERNPDVCI